MNEIKRELVNPSVTLDPDLLKQIAMEYVSKMKFFKGKDLCSKMEQGYNDELTGAVIVSCGEEA